MARRVLLVLLLLTAVQLHAGKGIYADGLRQDTIRPDPSFSVQAAWDYIQHLLNTGTAWREQDDSLHHALERLLEHTSAPYDTISNLLENAEISSIPVELEGIPSSDSIRIRWMNDSTFIIDTVGWNMVLFYKEELQVHSPADFSEQTLSDTISDSPQLADSALFMPDTVLVRTIDTTALRALAIPMHRYSGGRIIPPVPDPSGRRYNRLTADSLYLVFTDTLFVWMADHGSPFYRLSGEYQLDSLEAAVGTLLEYNLRRDSTRVVINDIYGKKLPFWITTGRNNLQRFWVKNGMNDSITLWIGNPAIKEITLLLEDDIDVTRPVREDQDHLPGPVIEPERELAEISLLVPDATFWENDFSSAFTFNQTYLSNWTKGGESSLATNLDVTGSATYNDNDANTQWINSARINIGTLFTDEKGLRKNNDLFEINSKFNKNASGKIGLSASFYMKSQLAKGYNYPNDSVVVSKFLNPGSLTIGLGAEYKPFKNTTINMAPLSYKNTFVLDTVMIDQTKHGISKDRRAKQELGTQVVLINLIKPMEDLSISNRLRLFSNYLDHPENIDVDWEMILDKKINWFFTVRLNLHLIYDDNVRFTVFDKNEAPVLLPDGSQKKVAKAQFKEFLGLSLLFRF